MSARWLVACGCGVAVAALIGVAAPEARSFGPRRAEAAQPYLPEGLAEPLVDQDHGEKHHHAHLHLADHMGAEHNREGIGEHHHHHHAHPHDSDPRHHHPM